MPWLAIGIYIALSHSKLTRLLPLTLAFAALFLAHTPLSLIWVACFLLSVAILLIFRKISLRDALISLLVSLFLALTIDAFFVLPILLDVNLIHQAREEYIEDDFLVNFILKFSEELPNHWWHLSLLKIFLPNFAILLLSVLVIKPFKSKEVKHILLSQQIVWIAFSLFMMTDLSLWLYNTVSTFRKIQFPWRFLAITSALTPYLLGYSLEVLQNQYSLLRKRIAIILILAVLVPITYKSAILNLESLNFDRTNLKTIDYLLSNRNNISSGILQRVPHKKVGDYYRFEFGGPSPVKFYLDRDRKLFQGEITSFLPETVPLQSSLLAPGKYTGKISRVEMVRGEGNVRIQDWHSGKRQLTVEATTEVVLKLKTFFYPGWKVRVTPFPTVSEPETVFSSAPDGRMQLKLPSGTYNIKIQYRGTLAERIGTTISLATVSLFIFLGLKLKFQQHHLSKPGNNHL
jgi:hypothetical protein